MVERIEVGAACVGELDAEQLAQVEHRQPQTLFAAFFAAFLAVFFAVVAATAPRLPAMPFGFSSFGIDTPWNDSTRSESDARV